MAKAVWKGKVIAESDNVEIVEGNIYFPRKNVKMKFLKESTTPYTCHWKGECQYYSVVVNGEINKDAAWSYPEPKEAAKNITGHVTFGNDVEVTE